MSLFESLLRCLAVLFGLLSLSLLRSFPLCLLALPVLVLHFSCRSPLGIHFPPLLCPQRRFRNALGDSGGLRSLELDLVTTAQPDRDAGVQVLPR